MALIKTNNQKPGNSSTSASATEVTESEQYDEYDEDSGNDDADDLDLSEEIILPDETETEEDNEEEATVEFEDDEDIFQRQISYPPIPEYIPPLSWLASPNQAPLLTKTANNTPNNGTKYSQKRVNPRERLGVLTPMEEVTEPPSSAGTEASGRHKSRERKRTRNINSSKKKKAIRDKIINSNNRDGKEDNNNSSEKKSILKSKSPTMSPDRKVKFVGAGSATPSERTVTSPAESATSEYSSLAESGRKNGNSGGNFNNDNAIPEETEEEGEITDNNGADEGQNHNEDEDEDGENTADKVPVMEQMEKVSNWQLGSRDALNNEDDFQPSSIDSEFASILDDIIAELHSWDRLAGTGAGITEINASRQDHFANVASQLASQLSQISAPTVMTNLPQLIPLITTLLNATESSFRAQLASLTTTNVLADRLRDCKTFSGFKVLPNADLTWLVRALCEISSESSRSVLKSEGTTTLAKLVKAAGPEMVCEPILFILMGNDEKIKKGQKAREGSGNIITTSISGGAPKIKATALDTLTFALLTFPRDDFNLDIVAKLACHCLLHPKRRVRQAALECLAVVAQSLGANVAMPIFRKFISEEEASLAEVNASNSSISTEASGSGSGSSSGTTESASSKSSAEVIPEPADSRSERSPSRIPVPIKVLEANLKAQAAAEAKKTQSASPTRNGGPTPASAVSARVSRHVLPTPNAEELVEYGVKIPASCQLLSRQSMKIGNQNDAKESSYSEESSTDNLRSATAPNNQNGRGKAKTAGKERLSSSGESSGSISNIEYSLMELEPLISAKGSGERKRGGGEVSNKEFVTAPDIAWILCGAGPVKKYDPSTMLPKEINSLTSKNRGKPQLPQRNSFGNTSGNESEFSSNQTSIIGSNQRAGNSDFAMRRIDSRGDLLQDTFTNKEASLNRFYYPNNHISPRGPLNSSDSLSSRYSSKSSYNLLPNKYSVHQNNKNVGSTSQYRGGGDTHPDFLGHHALLPGAYENPFGSTNGYSSSGTNVTSSSHYSHGHSELGSISRITSKSTKPLQSNISLRDKYLDSALGRTKTQQDDRRLNNDSQRSDSQQSGSSEVEEEEVSESENEKTEMNQNQRNYGNTNNKFTNSQNQAARKPPTGRNPIHNGNNHRAEPIISNKSINKQNEGMRQNEISSNNGNHNNGMAREYHVYHHKIELDSSVPPPITTSKATNKRGDADSAGSNHTRDSGVSLGSNGGSKTPPSVHNTPPSSHRSPVPPPDLPHAAGHQRSSSKGNKSQLQRNWRSSPDVPASDTDDGEPQFGSSRLSGNNSGDKFPENPNSGQSQFYNTASDDRMPIHRKPILARRGQSVGRPNVDPNNSIPSLRYPADRSRGNSRTRNGSRDNFIDYDEDDNIYGQDSRPTLVVESSKIRNSVSTGNILDEPESRRRIPQSKSTYFEIDDGDQEELITPRTGRVSRRDGPFGDMRVGYEEDVESDRFSKLNLDSSSSSSHTIPIRRAGLSKSNAKIVPTKIYKGSFREINSRKALNGPTQNEVFPADLKPVTSPKHALPMALGKLQSSDWDTNVDGFRQMVRILRFNPETIRADLHNLNMIGIKHLTNLRSQVCRAAILFFKEMFTILGRSMEADSEKIAEKLLDKAADTNKFIREDSGKALETMMNTLTPAKGLTCLDLFGTRHRNPAVRCMAAKLTATLVDTVGPERCLIELPERLLPMLCKLLQEGSLDTRTSAKSAMSILMTHPSFDAMLKRHVPADVMRHCQKNIDALHK